MVQLYSMVLYDSYLVQWCWMLSSCVLPAESTVGGGLADALFSNNISITMIRIASW